MGKVSVKFKLVILSIALLIGVVSVFYLNNISQYGRFESVGAVDNANSDIKSIIPLNDGNAFYLQTGNDSSHILYGMYNSKTKDFHSGFYLKQSYSNGTDTPKAIMLNSGKILILGQPSNSHSKAYGELFDPQTNNLSLASENLAPSLTFSTSTLKDGKILIVGGGENNKKIQKYDPDTNKFELVGEMKFRRISPSLVSLKNGNVVIFGGAKSNKSVELYDINKGIVSLFSNNYPIMGAIAMMGPIVDGDKVQTFVLNNGQIIVINTNIFNNINPQLAFYNPDKNAFRVISLTELRGISNFRPILLNNDNILFAGGRKELITIKNGRKRNQGYEYLSNAKIFDTKLEKFVSVNAEMKNPRSHYNAVRLNNDSVLIVKGNNNGRPILQGELFIPSK